jgi:hypothetical protein
MKKTQKLHNFKYEKSPQNLHSWPKILPHRADKNHPEMRFFPVSSQSPQKRAGTSGPDLCFDYGNKNSPQNLHVSLLELKVGRLERQKRTNCEDSMKIL